MALGAVTALRKNQWGIEATPATSTLTLGVQPTNGKTIIVGGITYTWTTGATAAAGQIGIGSNATDAQAAFVAAINGSDGFNAANPRVKAGSFAVNNAVITARQPGPAGNSLAFTGDYTDDTGNEATAFSGGAISHGTPVAATSVIAVEDMEWGDDDENLYVPRFQTGLSIRNTGTPVPVQHGTRFSLSGQPVVWAQLPHWLSMSVRGDVAPTYEGTGESGAAAYQWVFTRNPASDPTPLSMTLQRRFSNGSSNVDQRAAYALLSEISFSYAQNEHLRMGATGFARKHETSAITSALTLPTLNLGVSALSALYLNDAWADLGNTQVSEQVIGWELTIGTGFFPQYTADNRTSLDFTKHLMNGENVTLALNLTLLMDPTEYAAEKAHAEAQDLRAVRLAVTGPSGHLLWFDMLMRHESPTLFNIGSQDGQDIVSMSLVESTDQTNFLSILFEHPTVVDLA